MSSFPRQRLEIGGRVQGVGFRPFVARLARELELAGLVGNDSRGVFIEIEGPLAVLDQFKRRLQEELPPLARITRLEIFEQEGLGAERFEIVISERGPRQEAEISPDVATCGDCLRELRDAADRRQGYPFVNCTNCGPRYSIIQGIPYDRPQTTMACFSMCERCQGEYDDVDDRRYHAQPNACAVCGPRVWLSDNEGEAIEAQDAIAECARRLREGAIVAIKGLGGFHLACRADDEESVSRLRERKGREAKPLALMVADLDAARALVDVGPEIEHALTLPARPIVIAPRRTDANVARSVAPEVRSLGVMLPYTPLHTLLFDQGLPPLVMTSANASEEPLSSRNEEALARLKTIADAFLLHDREIARPIDDSVLMTVEDQHAPLIVVRRARGFVPEAIMVANHQGPPILALGGDLKATLCVLSGGQAVLSEHLGDLENPAAYRNFVAARERLLRLLRVEPEGLACDRHPAYHSRAHALELGLPLTEVQHHHAHAVACIAEHALEGEVVAICADGTGYGDDGAIWGGEVLICDARSFRRVGQLRYTPLFGGDGAARQTWRPALGQVIDALGPDWRAALPSFSSVLSEPLAELAAKRMQQAPRTSSLGRLFDSVAFLLRVSAENRFEGDAAIRLETLAERARPDVAPLELELKEEEGRLQIDARPLIRALLARLAAGEARPELARAFHRGVAAAFAQAAARAARESHLERVVLSGGCMLNRLLLAELRRRLEGAGLQVYRHQRVPPGDGGLALGQALVAAATVQP